jgi:hypothetical protein
MKNLRGLIIILSNLLLSLVIVLGRGFDPLGW